MLKRTQTFYSSVNYTFRMTSPYQTKDNDNSPPEKDRKQINKVKIFI